LDDDGEKGEGGRERKEKCEGRKERKGGGKDGEERREESFWARS